MRIEGGCCRNRGNVFFCLRVSGADSEKRSEQLERTSSISEEYMRYLNNPENEEKRFPVDRKKLERLILGEAIRYIVNSIWILSITIIILWIWTYICLTSIK